MLRIVGLCAQAQSASEGWAQGRIKTAPGFRDSGYRNATGGSGKLYNVGSHGYSWSSSVAESGYGYFLDFSHDGIHPNSDYLRAHGFQLRCLQE